MGGANPLRGAGSWRSYSNNKSIAFVLQTVQVARLLNVCGYDQLCCNSCYDKFGCNSHWCKCHNQISYNVTAKLVVRFIISFISYNTDTPSDFFALMER